VSLRLRLLLAVGVIAVVALVLADFATYSALRSSLYKQVDQTLAQNPLRLTRFVNGGACQTPSSGVFGGGNPGSGPPPDGGNANTLGFYPFIEILTHNGKVLDGRHCLAYVGTHGYSPQLPMVSALPAFTTQPDGSSATYFTTASNQSDGPAFRVQVTKTNLVDENTGVTQSVLAVVGQPIGQTTATLHSLLLIELAVTAGALVLALAGGWWLVRLGLRPLEDVERTADAIAAGNLDQRVPGADDTTEVGRLARALNIMLERIESAFSARVASEERLKESDRHLRQFVADASHELRTPIAAVAAYAELFERGAAQNADDLPRVVSGIRTETARMERLVTDLLTLARLDEGAPLQILPTELVGLCAEAVHTATTVGPAWPVTFTADHPVEVLGDATRLRQVVDNLLANVRAHTPEGTTATVRVDQVGATARVVVHDDGPGMPSEDAARVFERFYRVDPARGRVHGGTGLGLSIVSAIVTAHGGTVSADSAPGHGMTVTVSLPVLADVVAGPTPSEGATA
jgi:signal transduction histidine kinase